MLPQDTNRLIKNVAIDMIALTTYWGTMNLYRGNAKYALFTQIIGLGLMGLTIRNYY